MPEYRSKNLSSIFSVADLNSWEINMQSSATALLATHRHGAFKALISTLVLVMTAAVLGGCASMVAGVESRVSIFHQLPATGQVGATFTILPWRKEMQGSLEFAAYAQQVASLLKASGRTVVAQGEPASFAVFFDFGIDDGRMQSSTYVVPQWGVTGASGSMTSGMVSTYGNTSYVNSTTTTVPTFGVTGMATAASNSQVFRRFVNIDILDVMAGGQSPKKVYQGKLVSEGSCGNLPTVMPTLLKALLSDFPGRSGEGRMVSLPLEGPC